MGSSLILRERCLDLHFTENLVYQISLLIHQSKRIVLVSSGAISLGRRELGRTEEFEAIPSKQALASVGQIHLMNMYYHFFKKYRLRVGQVLLGAEDLSHRSSYLNARNTFLTLIRLGIVPIVNENDTVAVEEIKFGDNDTLSALVACLVNADLLIIISDISGLYTADPKREREVKFIPQVTRITNGIENMAKDSISEGRVGGMQTKINAAKIATRSGIPVIVGGQEKDFLLKVFRGDETGTLFVPNKNKLASRKQWIAYSSRSRGVIMVDDGARQALGEKGSSLLPAGVKKVKGNFEEGDTVSLVDNQGKEFARGIVNYSVREVERIKGQGSPLIKQILGYKYYDEIIHRDNLVIL